MKSNSISWMSVSILILSIFACGKDPVIPNEEELITTLTYTLTPSGGGLAVVLSFTDIDGDGGQDPVITTGTLAAGTTYHGVVELLNESIAPPQDITLEIEEEGLEHQLFYIPSDSNVSVTYDDLDTQGKPIGIHTNLSTGIASQGTLRIVLRHLPDKSASGVSIGDIQNAGGETDIEVIFPLIIE